MTKIRTRVANGSLLPTSLSIPFSHRSYHAKRHAKGSAMAAAGLKST